VDAAGLSMLRSSGLLPAANRGEVHFIRRAAGGDATLATTADGACVFFDDARTRLCALQRDGGAWLMPVACRNFPRVSLRDGRGLFITLSHFCPTAARLLLTAGDIAIVEAPASLSLGGEAEGLDATAVMPPLLRPGMLMDLDGYSMWEAEAVATLGERGYSPCAALNVLSAATADACGWSPGAGSLSLHMKQAFARARAEAPPEDLPCSRLEHAAKAFLAAHLFASWAAYQHGGLAAVVHAAESVLALSRADRALDDQSFIEAVRKADLRVRHTGDHVRPPALSQVRCD